MWRWCGGGPGKFSGLMSSGLMSWLNSGGRLVFEGFKCYLWYVVRVIFRRYFSLLWRVSGLMNRAVVSCYGLAQHEVGPLSKGHQI